MPLPRSGKSLRIRSTRTQTSLRPLRALGTFAPVNFVVAIMNAPLRAPTASDYAAIASWIPDAVAGLRWAGPRLSFPFAASDLPALLAVPGGGEFSYSLIDESGNPCGFGQHWVLQPGAVHLGRIIVAPDARGRGLGRVLCQQLISAGLHATSATAVTLRAYRDNLIAVGLYSSLGFVEVAAESTDDVLFMKMLVKQSLEPTSVGKPPSAAQLQQVGVTGHGSLQFCSLRPGDQS